MRPEGTRPPVFCVHAGGGSVMGYLDLVRAMPADVPVYGVESVGLDGTCEPLTRVEEMVDRYAAEVVRHTGAEAGDGDASRTVIGWGLGAVFACALAERLRAQGHRVGALVVVDGAAPDAEALTAVIKGASDDDYYSGMTETQIFERFAEHYELPLSAADIAGRTEEEARCIIAAAMREKTALAPDTGVEHLETLFELYRQNIAACREFVLAFDPRFCDYDVLLVRTDDSPGTEHDQALGWRRMFGDRVTQVWLPGDHYSVMKPPAVAKIAEFVDTALERVA